MSPYTSTESVTFSTGIMVCPSSQQKDVAGIVEVVGESVVFVAGSVKVVVACVAVVGASVAVVDPCDVAVALLHLN